MQKMNQISQDSKNEDDGMLDDDIYGDLESSIYLTARNPNCRTRVEWEARSVELEAHLDQAQLQIKELTEKLKKSEKNYMILNHNALCLQETAKGELERKNAMIANLAKQIENLTKRIKPSWNNEQKCPQITRADLNELARVIQTACTEAAGFKMSQIRGCLSENRQLNMPKLSEKKSQSITSHKISFENMHMYFYQEQCDFQRKEEVTFPQKSSSTLPNPEVVTSVQGEGVAREMAVDQYVTQYRHVGISEHTVGNRSKASPSYKEESNEAGAPNQLSTPKCDQAPTRSSVDTASCDVKSTTPDLMPSTAEPEHVRLGSRHDHKRRDEGERRTSHSSHRHEYKRPRSSSKERMTRSGRPRYDDRRYERSARDHYYERRRYDTTREYKSTKPSH